MFRHSRPHQSKFSHSFMISHQDVARRRVPCNIRLLLNEFGSMVRFECVAKDELHTMYAMVCIGHGSDIHVHNLACLVQALHSGQATDAKPGRIASVIAQLIWTAICYTTKPFQHVPRSGHHQDLAMLSTKILLNMMCRNGSCRVSISRPTRMHQ